MWKHVFEHTFVKNPGATQEEIFGLLQTWNSKLSEQEISELKKMQVNPFPKWSPYHDKYVPAEPSLWSFPQQEFPDSYIELLKYANGGEFQKWPAVFDDGPITEFQLIFY